MKSDNYLLWGLPDVWREANQTMKHLIRLHDSDLKTAAMAAAKIQQILASDIFPLMDELCLLTCSHCPDPCCLRAMVWIDFQDMLFLHLSEQMIPPTPLMRRKEDTCAYAGMRGCKLPRMSRSWVCTRYVCPPQMAILRKKPPRVRNAFDAAFQEVRQSRKAMEDAFIRACSPA